MVISMRTLPPRLHVIADEIAKHGRQDIVYDIGTDHAYLPIQLVRSGICDTVEACEAREGPLLKARNNVAVHGMTDRVKLFFGDGFSAFEPYRPGKIVAASGIGGQTLIEIIERGGSRAETAAALILQPMNSQELLREYLVSRGFTVQYERLAREERRIYSVLVCRLAGTGNREIYRTHEYYTGKRVLGTPAELGHFLRFTRRKLMNRYEGLISKYEGQTDKHENTVGACGASECEISRLRDIIAAIDGRMAEEENGNGRN